MKKNKETILKENNKKQLNNEYLKNKILESIKEAEDNCSFIDTSKTTSELYKECKSNKLFNKFKNVFKFCALKDINDNKKTLLLLINDYPFEEKDTIKVNEKLVDCIANIEKIFITIDELDIYRVNEASKHNVILKIIINNTEIK